MKPRPRVALTTTRDRGEELGSLASELNLNPVVLPCIEITPQPEVELRRVRRVCAEADILFITSARTIDILWEDSRMPAVPVALVGQMTARRARKHGADILWVGDDGSEELAQSIAGEIDDNLIAYPGAVVPNEAALSVLRGFGATVTTQAVYHTTSVAPDELPVDAAVFGSPSAVAGWAMGRRFDEVLIGAIGETTATSLGELGVEPDVVPKTPGYRALLALMADEFDRKEVRT